MAEARDRITWDGTGRVAPYAYTEGRPVESCVVGDGFCNRVFSPAICAIAKAEVGKEPAGRIERENGFRNIHRIGAEPCYVIVARR